LYHNKRKLINSTTFDQIKIRKHIINIVLFILTFRKRRLIKNNIIYLVYLSRDL